MHDCQGDGGGQEEFRMISTKGMKLKGKLTGERDFARLGGPVIWYLIV